MSNPYESLPDEAFWRKAVADRNPLAISDVYEPRFDISADAKISTAGSCFAQHIGKQFRQRGYNYFDAEPAPPLLDAGLHAKYGYGMYSARYGNVYSPRQLRQLFERAAGELTPSDNVWTGAGRYWDPYRPSIEPDGFSSEREMESLRASHFDAVNRIIRETDVFVFTFGLTEGWRNRIDGTVYPTCPGTIAGEYEPGRHEFVNFSFLEIVEDFEMFMERALRVNPEMKFLTTVSPVPLTATASGMHVLPATYASKSILRAACEDLRNRHECVDYFPSYELVASHPMRSMFFEPNLRSVSPIGVKHVMDQFFGAHADVAGAEVSANGVPLHQTPKSEESTDDVVCDEAILEEFGR